jgi:putative peptidoglycan binding protein
MHAPSTKRRPTGRRPWVPTRSRRLHRRARVASATLILAALIAGALLLPAGGAAAGGGTGSTSHGGQGGKSGNPFHGDGMWIWYVKKSSGGKLSKIARKAKNHGIRTLYIKSSDGTSAWSQFTPGLVKYFHRHGLRVCAWQYVYGAHPKGEAKQGAAAVRDGADCLVIDAEAEYEGRYGAADTYVDKLRHAIGGHFPTALSSFPYVDYHPSFPYSVFLGKGGARFNLPQVYWHAIGVGVGQADRHTIRYNRVYERGIYPVGQTYKDAGGRPSKKQIQKFRRLAISFGFPGVSWWSWQHTSKKQWRALGRNVDRIKGVRRGSDNYPGLSKGDKGDLVVWAQEHLRGAGAHLAVDGAFGKKTRRAVKRFQRKHHLHVDGKIGPQTWRHLLKVKPDMVDWSSKQHHHSGKLAPVHAEPRSANLPAVRYEIPPTEGAH